MIDTRLIMDVVPDFKVGRRLGLSDEETVTSAKETYEDMERKYEAKAYVSVEVDDEGEAQLRCSVCFKHTKEQDDVRYCSVCGAEFIGGSGDAE